MTEHELRKWVEKQKAWLLRSEFRLWIYRAIKAYHFSESPTYFTRSEAIRMGFACSIDAGDKSNVNWRCPSGQSNARKAIADMIDKGFLVLRKDGESKRLVLVIDGPVSDACEELGEPRLFAQDWPPE